MDIAFLGVGGISLKDGLTVYTLEDVRLKRIMIENAQRKVVLANGSKFGQTGLISYAPLSAVETVITDGSAPADMVEAISASGVRVLVAD